ncbi:serine/arginine repetitive matrix protein 2-like [Heliangelus exortis]|uniref:serine/arginine repetitive matrix protein 2-like n=1 Tax=Heliangelus exortis TaxID=472823 RepID=UPI003A9302C1
MSPAPRDVPRGGWGGDTRGAVPTRVSPPLDVRGCEHQQRPREGPLGLGGGCRGGPVPSRPAAASPGFLSPRIPGKGSAGAPGASAPRTRRVLRSSPPAARGRCFPPPTARCGCSGCSPEVSVVELYESSGKMAAEAMAAAGLELTALEERLLRVLRCPCPQALDGRAEPPEAAAAPCLHPQLPPTWTPWGICRRRSTQALQPLIPLWAGKKKERKRKEKGKKTERKTERKRKENGKRKRKKKRKKENGKKGPGKKGKGQAKRERARQKGKGPGKKGKGQAKRERARQKGKGPGKKGKGPGKKGKGQAKRERARQKGKGPGKKGKGAGRGQSVGVRSSRGLTGKALSTLPVPSTTQTTHPPHHPLPTDHPALLLRSLLSRLLRLRVGPAPGAAATWDSDRETKSRETPEQNSEPRTLQGTGRDGDTARGQLPEGSGGQREGFPHLQWPRLRSEVRGGILPQDADARGSTPRSPGKLRRVPGRAAGGKERKAP